MRRYVSSICKSPLVISLTVNKLQQTWINIEHLCGVREAFLSCKACLAQLDRASDSNAWNLKAVSSTLMVGLFLSWMYCGISTDCLANVTHDGLEQMGPVFEIRVTMWHSNKTVRWATSRRQLFIERLFACRLAPTFLPPPPPLIQCNSCHKLWPKRLKSL